MNQVYRWIYNLDNSHVYIDDLRCLIVCNIDKDDNHYISQNAITKLQLKKGDRYKLVVAARYNHNFMDGMLNYIVEFDGEKFIDIKQHQTPNIEKSVYLLE